MPGAVDGDLVLGEEGVERLDDPRVDGQRAAAVLGAGQLAERVADLGVPQDVEPQPLAVERPRRGQARGRRVLARQQRLDAAVGAGVQARVVLVGERGGAGGGQRREQHAVALDEARQQRIGRRAGARRQHPPAAAVVAHRRDVADPAALDLRQPGVDLGARRQVGEALEHLGDVDADPVVDGRPPLARVPVEAPAGNPPHDGDDVRVVGEAEHDDLPALRAPAKLDVRDDRGQAPCDTGR